jgi:CHASE3 domain sensor protein
MISTRQKIPRGAELLSLFFALVLVLLIAVLSYRAWIGFRRSSDQLAVSQAVSAQTNALLSALKDAETGHRGFLLTERNQYLRPYQQALVELNEASATRPDQTKRLDALRPLLKEKLEELKQTIELRRIKGTDAALTVVLSD